MGLGLNTAALLAALFVCLVQGVDPPKYAEESTEVPLPRGYIIEYDVRDLPRL